MTEDCIFCRIVEGDIPSRTVYETEDVLAFLDANPLAPGHTLVIPKAHHPRVSDLPDDVGTRLFGVLSDLAPAVERAVDAEGVTIGMNDGEAAGQEVMHAHVHIVPREEGDGAGAIHSLHWPRPDLDDEAFDEVADAIRDTQ